MVTITPIASVDLPRLRGLYDQLFETSAGLERMEAVYRRIAANSDYYLLGARGADHELIGTIMGVVCLDLLRECKPFLVMENLVVDARWRRRGVAKALLQAIESIARERGCVFVQFCSSAFRTDAHAFYEAAGYKPGEVQGYRKYL